MGKVTVMQHRTSLSPTAQMLSIRPIGERRSRQADLGKQIGSASLYLGHAYDTGKPLKMSGGSDLLEESETVGGLGRTRITIVNYRRYAESQPLCTSSLLCQGYMLVSLNNFPPFHTCVMFLTSLNSPMSPIGFFSSPIRSAS